MEASRQDLPGGIYIELVRSLFVTLLPTVIMTSSFVVIGALATIETGDRGLGILTMFGALALVARIAYLLMHRAQAASDLLDIAAAQDLERRFSRSYLLFAAILGWFGARAVYIAPPEITTLIVGLLFGYGAGVASGIALRPRIGIPSLVLAVVPTVLVLWLVGSLVMSTVGALLAVFLVAGINSIRERYRSTVKEATMRRLMSTLARRDALTGLSNRLSLRERFDESVTGVGSSDLIAVHCLDLDRFKPVNDSFGHPVGDALLKAVSARLNSVLRRSDFAARTGGDEFVVLQFGTTRIAEAENMARRIAHAIAQPYSIAGHEISISASVGYALSTDEGNDLDHLTACADAALCRIKRAGGGIASYERPDVAEHRRAA